VAFARGAHDDDGITRSVGAGMILSILLGGTIAVLVAYSPRLLILLGQEPHVAAHAADYLPYAAAGIVPSLLFTCFRGLTVGLSQPGPITLITILAFILKAVLNFSVLLFTSHLSPERQIELGLALCGLVSTATYALMALGLGFYCRQAFFRFMHLPSLNGAYWRQVFSILRLGMPIGATYGIDAGLFTAIALIIGDSARGPSDRESMCLFLVHARGGALACRLRQGRIRGRRRADERG
jgi:multidrug resistance protein, MATE family